ncbi:DNA repair protein complementing XP-C cells homolog isoform X1 [Drosophila novamexicana]|uniref:DNA repair protein complementing XP-C cells homolog isoform X1 n=1 Tax=Drosophila novamexicana TaxID=47314 RepID=UPI0011E5D279|nr:DNA repair protein complementing XP-C cells homolog isoform X1 [Drosophila novamexicana]
MSDEEEESLSEGFSASEEDEWKPGKDARGGESSDDDDSEFEETLGGAAAAASASGRSSACAAKKREQKPPSGIKGASVKKRKPSGQSLRSKLYNKYRPPPKTFPTSPTQNSPTASGSASRLTASKNAKTPNESNQADSSSESSVEDYLVNPADIDLRSSFFTASKEKSPAPQFDCNAGITNLSDSGSGSEDNNDSSFEDNNAGKAFDFRDLLENANSLERTRAALLTKRNATATPPPLPGSQGNAAAMDVNALLALGENQNYANEPDKQRERRRSLAGAAAGGAGGAQPPPLDAPSRLSKTKSTRIKRHTKTRPASTVLAAGGDSDDSDFEEVADAQLSSDDQEKDAAATPNVSGDLEIHVGLPTRTLTKEQKTQHELELALKRRMNRDIKDRQLLMHKVSLLCLIARSLKYNRLLADTSLMQAALKLLPSRNAYPTEKGVELKYLQSFVTWFKTAIKLLSQDLYAAKATAGSKRAIIEELLAQIKRKEARCKQDMIFIFIILARGMGMNCRLIVNLQPMALRPQASDLIPIKLKQEEKNKSGTIKSEADEDEEEQSDSKSSKTKAHKSSSKAARTTVKDSSSKSSPAAAFAAKAESKPSSSVPAKAAKKLTEEHKKDPSTQSTTKSSAKSNSKTVSTTKAEAKSSSKELSERPKSSAHSKAKAKAVESSSKPEVEVKPSGSQGRGDSNPAKDKPQIGRLKRAPQLPVAEATKKPRLEQLKPEFTPVARRTRKASADTEKAACEEVSYPAAKIGSPVVPKLVLPKNAMHSDAENANPGRNQQRVTRSRSKSPKVHISPVFLKGDQNAPVAATTKSAAPRRSQDAKAKISPTFLTKAEEPKRELRTRQQKAKALAIPQLDGGDDSLPLPKKRPKLEKLQKSQSQGSESASTSASDSTPNRAIKKAPVLPKAVQQLRKDRRVLSTDDEGVKEKRKTTASDMWVEVWSEVEEQWICIDLFKGKIHDVDSIRRNASSNLAYVFAFQDDLSLKDVTARYCPSWTTTVRKSRVEKAWLDETLAPYLGRRTKRDIREDEQLRRIHSDKPLPKSISEFKDHPLYVLERHLLKFQGIYPADAPTLGFIRGEPVYSRDCVHLMHSRDIWLKSARVVKLGEQPYKIVKARPKWDKLTRTVIKDQPLEIFGYWQTQEYEPPTAENGLVPRNAYGNVELFKACMLPKKTVHLRLPGLMRVCKKLNIDCANAVIGFDFHQGACHPMYDGFVVCEEFGELVTAAWEEDQQEQARKEQEKYEARVYGNWKKLIKGLLIRERLKRKYNF